jgi:hypothetical protein
MKQRSDYCFLESGLLISPLSNEVKEGKTKGLDVPEFLLACYVQAKKAKT